MKTDCTKNKNWQDAQLRSKETFRLNCKLRKEKEIEEYNKNPNKCQYCNKDIPYKKSSRTQKFCNTSCAGIFNSHKREWSEESRFKRSIALGGTGKLKIRHDKCINCNSELPKRRYNKYCNSKCQQEYQGKIYLEDWKNGKNMGGTKYGVSHIVRKYIKEKFDNKCCKCGWCKINPYSKKSTLQIEHIDGNGENHKEDNLELICPNCHSLTKTFGALNIGHGRDYRNEQRKVQRLKEAEFEKTIKDLQTSLI